MQAAGHCIEVQAGATRETGPPVLGRRRVPRPAWALEARPITAGTIPRPTATAAVELADGGTILLRRHGYADGPRIVLSHGSSFSADAYFPFWSLLLRDFDVVVYDLRNHGQNPLGDLGSHHMPMMVWDNLRVVRAIDRHFGPKPKIGVYHSVSAAIAVFQAVEESSFAGLVLFDPPVCPPGLPEARERAIRSAGSAMSKRAAARQGVFARWEELAGLYRRSRAFALVPPEDIDLLARTTLRACDAGYELCCPPAYEAKLFEQLYKWALAIDIFAFDFPLKVIGGDPTTEFSFLPAVSLEEIAQVEYDFVPDTTHLLQLEQPLVCTELVIDFLKRSKLA